jgi:polysaccharide deacetylase 2 family uncharacterized protein YibQ
MGALRRLLVFILFTTLLILLGKLAGRYLPRSTGPEAVSLVDSLPDSTNALPVAAADTTGGRWHDRLFDPLLESNDLTGKNLRKRQGYWEIVLPKGKPIHEYAFEIEQTCRRNGIDVIKGVELRPSNQGVEYLLRSEGQVIKLRASLGKAFLAGSARLAIVFTGLDSLRETQLAAIESAQWEKTLVVDPHADNPVLKKLRFTHPRNEVLAELPMEPSTYPYVNPGPHAVFIHHSAEDVDRLLSRAMDSLPKARGYATRLGDRAIENQPLLEKLFRITSSRDLFFLDLTGSPRSLTRQVAGGMGARYRVARVDKDSLGVGEEFANRAAAARKVGDALWVVDWSPKVFQRIDKAVEEHGDRLAEAGIELVTLTRLSGAERDSSASR